MSTALKRPYLVFLPFAVATFVFQLLSVLRYASGISGADGQWYWNETELFLDSNGLFDERQFSRSYQYPGFIAFAGGLRVLLSADSPGFIYVANAVLLVGLGFLTLAVGKWAFNGFVGLVAGVLVMWVPSIAWAVPTIGYEVLFVFLVMSSLAAYVAAAQRRDYKSTATWALLIASCLLLFAAYFTVSKAIVILPVLVILTWQRFGRGRGLTYAGIFVIGLLLLGLRNLVTHGVFFFTSLNTGATLWLSNNPEAKGLYMDPPWIPGVGLDNNVVQIHPSFGVPVNLYNDLFTSAAVNWIIRNPADFIDLLWVKLGYTWGPPTLAASSSPAQVPEWLYPLISIGHYLVIVLAVIAAVIWAWSRPKIWRAPALVFWSGLVLIIATMPFHGSPRYQSAFMPMVLLFAVAGAQVIWLRVRGRLDR